jgi:hypothetical protein
VYLIAQGRGMAERMSSKLSKRVMSFDVSLVSVPLMR